MTNAEWEQGESEKENLSSGPIQPARKRGEGVNTAIL